MMKKTISKLALLLSLGILSAGIAAYANEAEADTETVTQMEAVTETETQMDAVTDTEEGASDVLEYEGFGYTVKAPQYWEGLKGSLNIFSASPTTIFDEPDLYAGLLLYIPYPSEKMYGQGELSEKDVLTIAKKIVEVGSILSFEGDREMLVDVLRSMGAIDPDEEVPESMLVKVGEADGYQFFVLDERDETYADSLDEDYVEEYNGLLDLIVKKFEQAEYYAPDDPMDAMKGKTIQFTSTDLDGNEMTSEELFADNEITMVNLWGVWCPNCVNEMEELAAIHTRIQEKGCGIVGVEWEKEPGDETYQKARKLMEEKGTNYPSVLMPEGDEIMGNVTSYPTTFYVDREGKILDMIVGARVNAYESTLDALLAGETIEETEKEGAGSYIYRVYVKDENDQPLEEAVVQFCDETTCRFGETDADGCAEFDVTEEKVYDVHIMEAPDGYAYDEEEIFNTDETASDMTIVLKAEE